MKPVVWGILSVSTHYKQRVHTYLRKSPLVDIRGIASRSRERASEAARDLGLQKAYGSYEELLADREIEAVYIPLPNHMHAEWVKKAADAGKHVLCEKPFAMDAKEAEQAIRHAERKGVLVMEAFMYRFHPQWKRAREIVRSGEIGEVQSVNTIFSYMLTDPTNIRNVLAAGGGGIPDIGCYVVSSARFLMGREPIRVVSLVHRDRQLKTDILASGILDFGVARSVFTVGTQSYPWPGGRPGLRRRACGSYPLQRIPRRAHAGERYHGGGAEALFLSPVRPVRRDVRAVLSCSAGRRSRPHASAGCD